MACSRDYIKNCLLISHFLYVACNIFRGTCAINLWLNLGSVRVIDLAVPIILLSSAILTLTILAYYGAMYKNLCCIIMYAVSLLIMVISESTLFIYDYFMYNKLIYKLVSQAWYDPIYEERKRDALQMNFKCCGRYGFKDYITAEQHIPNSCCSEEFIPCNAANAYSKGCEDAIESYSNYILYILLYTSIFRAAVGLIAFVFACALAKQVCSRRKSESSFMKPTTENST